MRFGDDTVTLVDELCAECQKKMATSYSTDSVIIRFADIDELLKPDAIAKKINSLPRQLAPRDPRSDTDASESTAGTSGRS